MLIGQSPRTGGSASGMLLGHSPRPGFAGSAPLLHGSVPLSQRVAVAWSNWRKRLRARLPPKFTLMHACVMAIAGGLVLFMVLSLLSLGLPLPLLPSSPAYSAADAAASLARVRAAIASPTAPDPRLSVAFAIPVGGRTERSAQLKSIIETLVAGGAPREQIFVFEDVRSRRDGLPSPKLRDTVARINADAVAEAQARGENIAASAVGQVQLIGSNVARNQPETREDFGIHLARHYKFMLDYIFVGDDGNSQDEDEDAQVAGTNAAGGKAAARRRFDFLTIIEDDLVLAPDTAKFFQQMSRVMRADPSLYCVAAHQDNAFMATSAEAERLLPASSSASAAPAIVDLGDFPFRRGNHFMAPGWMTSREIYLSVVRDRWLDEEGNYKFKAQLHLRNGHWDRFFDSLIGPDRDCIFPELPRIVHEGADGFTVSKKGQMELYSNLRLSQLDPFATDYGDLASLSREGYIALTHAFLSRARRLRVLEEWRHHRYAELVYTVPAQDDKDNQWNAPINEFFGLIGVGGYGGWEGYVKVRGIFRGAVFIRWGTNLVMLVGAYSPYMEQVASVPYSSSDADAAGRGVQVATTPTSQNNKGAGAAAAAVVAAATANVEETPRWPATRLQAEGCVDSSLLEHTVGHYTRFSLSAEHCALSCLHLGYPVAGVVGGEKCMCAAAVPSARQSDSYCSMTCVGAEAASRSTVARAVAVLKAPFQSRRQPNWPCGGPRGRASLYTLVSDATALEAGQAGPPSAESFQRAPPDAKFVMATEGQSCTEACAAIATDAVEQPGAFRCAENLFPLLHRSCATLRTLSGCAHCAEEKDIERGFATPGRDTSNNVCTLSKGKYVQCTRKPQPGYLRACVCTRAQRTD
jgi:hypothetical protein